MGSVVVHIYVPAKASCFLYCALDHPNSSMHNNNNIGVVYRHKYSWLECNKMSIYHFAHFHTSVKVMSVWHVALVAGSAKPAKLSCP